MKIGVNSFGLGPYLHKDAESVWNGLREAGVSSIEPCIAFQPISPVTRFFKKGLFDGVFPKEKAAAQIRDLRRRGFEVFSFHLQNVPFNMEELKKVLPFMEENDLDTCVYSFMDDSVEKIRALAPVIRDAVGLFCEAGKELLIHNHDMEWRRDGESSVMRWLLESIPELRFELDLGWAEYAGVDSVRLLRVFPDRFPLLHIKEIAAGAKAWTGKPFCTAPGEGILPLKEILSAAEDMPIDERALIIDQDDSISGDIIRDVSRGIENIRQLRR